MDKLFIALYHFFTRQRGLFWALFIGCFGAAGFLAAHIKLEEDIAAILPRDKKIDQLNEVFQNSRFLDKLVITVSAKDTAAEAGPDSLVSYAASLTDALKAQYGGYIESIQDRANDSLVLQMFGAVHDNLPLFLDSADYRAMDSMGTPGSMAATLQRNIATLSSPAGFALKNIIVQDPAGISLLGLKKLQQLQYDENFSLYDSYVMTRDLRHLMLFVSPKFPPGNTGKNQVLLDGIKRITDSLSSTVVTNTAAEYFGATAVSASNAAQLRKDTMFTQGLTVAFLVIFIGVYFRKKRAPLLIMVPVAFGALFALALVYLIKGSLSVIALGTGSVILGIAVNYSLHVFNHYRHTRSMEQVIGDLSMPLTVGSLTTIGGFLCLEFVESAMLRDLGLFAALSLVGASLCSLIFLPQLVMLSNKEHRQAPTALSWIDKLADWRPEHNRRIIAVILLLTIVFGWTARRVRFEPDMMRMNYMSADLKKADTNLAKLNAFSLQSLYLISSAPTLDEALRRNETAVAKAASLRQSGLVSKYSGVSNLLLSQSLQQARIAHWNAYWTAQRKKSFLHNLEAAGDSLHYNRKAFDGTVALLNKNYGALDTATTRMMRANFLEDYIIDKPGKATVITLLKVSPQNRQLVYQQFDGSNTTIIDKQYLTGRLVEIINGDFGSIAWMSSILVFTVLLISYGRIELTLVSFIPMFISWIWILGIMGMLGITFNIVNIIISALIFGLGDDYSLFVMDGLLQEYKTGKKNLSSYKSSILLSAITTIAGLGVLIFAKHPALRSIALIAIIGILCVVVIGQLMIPFLFNFLIRNRVARGRFPWTFFGLFKSAFAFTWFASGSVVVSLAALLLVKLNPFSREKGKLLYHHVIQKFAWSLMYVMPNVKKVMLNVKKEVFSTPAVIVANHSSSLDVLLAMMLHLKVILFINRRVWSLPFVGFVVRCADFFPTTENAEEGLDKIADRVKNGYSVVVFPEGTRSEDGVVKRFHKGAFYVAEKLNLDIVPMLIHGTSYTLSKDDFLVKDGRVTVSLLPRIKSTDPSFGEGYAERAKLIGRYFRAELNALAATIEQPAYFREQLIYNYLYKGPVLEWYMRIKTRMEKNYVLFDQLLPRSGSILDIGCGYGFMSYMLYFRSNERTITGVDYDEQKIATANHCFSKTTGLNFIHADVTQFQFDRYDAIVLMDMLHYLEPSQQELVIEQCIAHLLPGGRIIIRDGNAELKERQKGTALTEVFSTMITGFNKTSGKGLHFLKGSAVRAIAAKHGMVCREIDESKYTSNIVFVLDQVPVLNGAAI